MEQESLRLGELIHRAYVLIKRRIVLVLAIILIITVGGIAVAYIRKPVYTASEHISYKANGNMTAQYFQSVVEFCDKGCVIDRANFYYDNYVKSGNKYDSVDKFINDIQHLEYDATKKIEKKYITSDKVSVSASLPTSSSISYIFTIKYTDPNKNAARDKVLILFEAVKEEVNIKSGVNNKYFGVDIILADLGTESISSDWSKSNIVILSFAVGVIVALLSVYIINIADNTVKEKEEIERLTGTDLLAFIDDQEA